MSAASDEMHDLEPVAIGDLHLVIGGAGHDLQVALHRDLGGVQPQADQQAAFSFVKHGEIVSFYWAEGALSYALVGRFERDQLMGIAQTVHQKLSSGPASRSAPSQPPQQPQSPPEAKPVPAPASQPPAAMPDQERPKAS